jgi:hypothetical protein
VRELTLIRFAYTADGTLGRLGPFCTLEEEWQDNRPNVSCIPTGTYRCARRFYHRGGYWTFEVIGVPGRSAILFHAGNTEEATAGCILLGRRFGVLVTRDEDTGRRVPKLAVLDSRAAFSEWFASLAGVDEFTLHVRDYDG